MDFWDNDSREWNENESDREDSEEENELTNSPDDENDPDDPPSSDDEVSIYSGPPSPTNSEYTDDDSPENGDYEDMADFSDSDHYWDDSDHDIYYSSSTNHSYGGDTGTTTPSQLIKKQEEEAKSRKILNEAMKSGKVTLRITNILIQGEAGVGKTSTRCILTGQPPPTTRNSTPLANPPLQFRADCDAMITETSSDDVGGNTRKRTCSHISSEMPPQKFRHIGTGKIRSHGNKWKPIDKKELTNIVADTVSALEHQKQSNQALQKMATTAKDAEPEQGLDMLPTFSSPSSAVTSISPTVVADIHGEIVELMTDNKLNSSDNIRDPKEILGVNWIYFIDSGGQPQFHNLLPHFVHSLSIVLFALRLSERLDAHPVVENYEQGKLVSTPYTSHLTTEDTLKFLIRSIQSHTVDGQNPKLIFIGTFLDKIEECSESLLDKNKKLFDLLIPDRFKDQLIFSDDAMQELIFPINAQTPGVNEEEIADLIRSEVQEAPSRVVDVPVWWYILEIVLQKISSQTDRKVLSKKECLEVACQLNISEDALVEALKFFHSQSIFLYYPDILPDVVFTSTQVLLDKLTELVEEAFYLRDACTPNDSYVVERTSKSGKWQKFRDQGIVTLESLEHFDIHYVEGLFSAADLLKIFTKLLILTPIPLATKPQVTTESTAPPAQYLMPSLLRMLPVDKLEQHCVPLNSSPPPLLIRFPNGWPRAGVFCCLQVYLIQQLHWKLVMNKRKPNLIAQNCVMLCPPESSCHVILIDSFAYIEVHLKAEHSLREENCYIACESITQAIYESCKVLHYSHDKLQLAFFCTACTDSKSTSTLPQPHHAELLQQECRLKCTLNETVSIKAGNEHMMWIRKTASSQKMSDNSPSIAPLSEAHLSLPTLNDILNKTKIGVKDIDKECSDEHILDIALILEKWELVARSVGLNSTDIETIKHSSTDLELQRMHFLERWKKKFAFNATYRCLVEGLLKCNLTDLAVRVCSLLSSKQE